MKFKTTHALRYGSYSLIATAIVLVVIILLNLGMGMLPKSYTTIAADPQNLYEISSVSRSFMKNVTDDITVYVVATESQTDNTYLWIREYAERYSDLSSKVTVKTVDPALYPNFLPAYTDEALSAAQTHLVIVNEKNGRSHVVPYSQIVYTQYTQEELLMFYYYYGYTPDNPSFFDVENALLSSIDYVTMAKLPTVYYTTGHGEITFDATLTSLIKQENITLEALSLTEVTEIPADVDAIIINTPNKDFTAEEIAVLRTYAEKGGNVLLLSYYNTSLTDRYLTNLYGFAEEYGMTYHDVLVFEGNSSHYYSAYGPSYILPQLTENIYTSAVPANTRLVMALCHDITVSELLPDGVTVTPLMTTTTSGYAKTEIKEDTTTSKEEGDIEGQFLIGAVGSKKASGATSRFFWFTSPLLFDGGTAQSFSNLSYVMAMLSDICQKEASITVGATQLQVEALSVSSNAAKVWGAILIGIIPAVVLLCGFGTWYRRSRR